MRFAAACLVLLLIPHAAAAPYMMLGGGPGNTGDIREAPTSHDRAYVLDLGPDELTRQLTGAPPVLIIDGLVYIALTSAGGAGPLGASGTGRLVVVQLASATIVHDVPFTDPINSLASDGARLVVSYADMVEVRSLAALDTPGPAATLREMAACSRTLLGEEGIYIACLGQAFDPDDNMGRLEVFLVGFDGQIEAAYRSLPTDVGYESSSTNGQTERALLGPNAWVEDMALGLDHLMVMTNSPVPANDGQTSSMTWKLDRGGLRLASVRPEYHPDRLGLTTDASAAINSATEYVGARPRSIHATDVGYLELHRDLRFNPWAPGAPDWILEMPSRGETGPEGTLAIRDDLLVINDDGTLLAFNPSSQQELWRFQLPPYSGSYTDQVLLADGWVYVTSNGQVRAFTADGERGESLLAAGAQTGAMAIGEGFLVFVDGFGGLHVFGATEVGIDLEAALDDGFPAPGREATVSVGDTRPGAFGSDLAYTIEWGDGTTDGGAGPEFHHAFPRPGTYDIRVEAGNFAGQEASQLLAIHVGGSPPNFVSNAFAPDNQESTFFLLGLIVILLGSAFGAVRLRRKRGRLRKELAHADAIVAAHAADADRLRHQLREHRSRARRLFLDGRLDEGSTGILERHIDELLRDHRLHAVESELGFMPHQLFRSMQEMLGDARVTQLERNNFLIALGAEAHLTPAEKKRVQRFVETWHREDAA